MYFGLVGGLMRFCAGLAVTCRWFRSFVWDWLNIASRVVGLVGWCLVLGDLGFGLGCFRKILW